MNRSKGEYEETQKKLFRGVENLEDHTHGHNSHGRGIPTTSITPHPFRFTSIFFNQTTPDYTRSVDSNIFLTSLIPPSTPPPTTGLERSCATPERCGSGIRRRHPRRARLPRPCRRGGIPRADAPSRHRHLSSRQSGRRPPSEGQGSGLGDRGRGTDRVSSVAMGGGGEGYLHFACFSLTTLRPRGIVNPACCYKTWRVLSWSYTKRLFE